MVGAWWSGRAVGLARWRHRRLLGYLLTLLAGCLLLVMRQIDAVLGRMGAIGDGVRGSGLGFPWAAGDVGRYAWAWEQYGWLAPAGGTLVATPDELHRRLLVLDLLFVAVYTPLLALVLGLLLRWAEREFAPALNAAPAFPGLRGFLADLWRDLGRELSRLWTWLWTRLRKRSARRGDRAPESATAGPGAAAVTDPKAETATEVGAGDRFDVARVRLLRWAIGALLVLAVADVVEDVLLVVRYTAMPADADALDALFVAPTWIKTLALAVVLGPMAVAAATALHRSPARRQALVGARGVVVVVALLVVLLVLLPLGAQQVDDVVRAWRWYQAAFAVAATAVAAAVVVGAIRELTDRTPENLRPRQGRDPQPLLLLGAVGLAAVGLLVWWLLGAWGLLVPAGILLALFLLGCVIARPDESAAAKRAEAAGAGDRDAAVGAGRGLAHTLGALVCLVGVWTIARASAFDVFVRPGPSGSGPVLGSAAVLLAALGLAVGLVRHLPAPGPLPFMRPARRRSATRWWIGPAVAALVALWATVLPGDATAIALPAAIGTVGMVMIGVAAAAGALALVAAGTRKSGVGGYALVPVFRLVGLKRFPVIALLLVWALVVAQFDAGGFHDARRSGGEARPAPNLLDAYTLWHGPGTGARPLVIVAAQGGGIRAAVWTALVMECLFGPTPVSGDVSGDADVCPGASAGDRLPVFLASGASGGSVGLAAWSARLLDVAEGTGHEPDIGAVLPEDHLAPDMARLLSGDALYLLLAHDLPDRAEMLERSWEPGWRGAPGTGLARGIRAAWAQANGADRWRMPVLAMNGAQIEDGCRFVASPVDMWLPGPAGANWDEPDDARCGSAPGTSPAPVDGHVHADVAAHVDALPRTTELVDYLCAGEDMPLSAAAHLSSRFPYVSPTARVAAEPCGDRAGLLPAGSVSFLTDGGLADNSGAATAVQLWRALQPAVAERESATDCVVPVFVQIDNAADAEPADGGRRPPNELTAPVEALFGQTGGREAMAREEARASFAGVRTAGGRPAAPGSAYVRIAPAVQPGAEPPLGWTLSPSTVRDMRAQLLSGPNRAEIQRLGDLLDGGLSCS